MIKDHLRGFRITLIEGETVWIIEENGETFEAPMEPDSDESNEHFLLREAIDVLHEAIDITDKFAEAGDNLIEAMQKQYDVRETRQDQFDEWESQRRSQDDGNDSSSTARAQGSGDFDIVEFFSDL